MWRAVLVIVVAIFIVGAIYLFVKMAFEDD